MQYAFGLLFFYIDQHTNPQDIPLFMKFVAKGTSKQSNPAQKRQQQYPMAKDGDLWMRISVVEVLRNRRTT